MSEDEPIRNTVRVILINKENKILLLHVDDPLHENKDGSKYPSFWITPGGGIDSGETIQQAAARELFEETGIESKNVQLGPIVWEEKSSFIRAKRKITLNQKFILAHTENDDFSFDNITESEKTYLKNIKWFSYSQLSKIDDIIRPLGSKKVLLKHLEEGFAGLHRNKGVESKI